MPMHRRKMTGSRRGAGRPVALAAALLLGSMPRETGAETLAQFQELRAVQTLHDGSFAAIGPMQPVEDGRTSGLLVIGADGRATGPAVAIPVPDGYAQGYLNALEVLPDGGLVAAGWVQETSPNEPADAWLVRLDRHGRIDASVVLEREGDQKLYSVRLVSSGELIAVGRDQVSQKASDPSSGLAVMLDREQAVLATATFDRGDRHHRAGFHDIAELADGSLALVGWATPPEGGDDVWLVRTTPDLSEIANTTRATGIHDLAWSATAIHGGVAVVAAASRDDFGFVAAFDPGFAELGEPAMLQGGANLRFVRALALDGAPALVAGGVARDDGQVRPYFATYANGRLSAVDVPGDAGAGATYFAAAAGTDGRVLLVGRVAGGQPGAFDGIADLAPKVDLCPASGAQQAALGDALARRDGVRLPACVAPEGLQIALDGVPAGSGLLVAPFAGEVDVMLLGGASTLDVSLNRHPAPDFITLPAGGDGLVLSLAPVGGAHAAVSVTRVAPAGAADWQDAPPGSLAPPQRAFLFGRLGYDLAAVDGVDRRSVQAFQASAGMPATGILSGDDELMLYRAAARAAEADAHLAAATAQAVAARYGEMVFETSPEDIDQDSGAGVEDEYEYEYEYEDGDWDEAVEEDDAEADGFEIDEFADGGPEDDEQQAASHRLARFAGGMSGGHLYGTGTFDGGSAFSGAWDIAESYDGEPDPRRAYVPKRGLLTTQAGCSIALEQIPGDIEAGPHLEIPRALIVVRDGAQLVFAGYSGADDEAAARWTQHCFPQE